MQQRIDSTAALWGGVIFSFVFTGLIFLTGKYWLEPAVFAPDRPGMWYLWQLQEPTWATRFSAWGFYLAHQVAIWYLIWKAQSSNLKYSSGLHGVNIAALAVNALFITLHLVQTHAWYDGLAQDTPEWTSQASVTLMLAGILIIENQRRGLFFGKPVSFVTNSARAVRKYHGYYFSWAVIYTFWYHPMEYTSGHLIGFLYMFLLLIQGSLFFTRAHLNRYWTLFLEMAVVGHAILVAIMNGDGWPHFLAGFLGMFVITQMHGLGLSRRTRWVLGLTYLAMVITVYALTEGLASSFQAALIPAVELLLVVICSGLVLGVARLAGGLPARTTAGAAESRS